MQPLDTGFRRCDGGLLIFTCCVVLLILLLLLTLVPLKRAEHRRPWQTGSGGGEAGAEAFSPRHGWRVEKPRHGREAQGIGSRFCFFGKATQRRGRPSFGYFPWATRKVTRATARNTAPKPANNSAG